MSRTQNAIKNVYFGILGKSINLIFAFAARTVFIYILGNTYLGVNGLYSEILSLLSFAELGFGSAMTFSMYKPVADGDKRKVVQLLQFYKKIYRIIAGVIAMLGLCLTPFLGSIVKGADWISDGELVIFFLIYLFNTVVGYFVTYKYIYLNALQKNYIQTNIDTVITIVSNMAQILVIVVCQSFLGYLLVNSAILLVSRIGIVMYLDRKYPILKESPNVALAQAEKDNIYKEVQGLAVHQFASVAVHSTDNVLISMLTEQGVTAVGLISNYTMLMNAALGFITTLFGSVTSGFGNMVASSTAENFRKVFKEINFANFWVYGFCSIAFWILIPPFITLWIGADKVVDEVAFTLIIINCYLQGQSTIYNNARIAKGNFNKDKGWAIVQALTNLVVSVAAAKALGLVGIYIGTVVSRLVYVIFRPYSTYKFLFGESSAEYYKTLIIYFSEVVIAAVVTKACITHFIPETTVWTFLYMMVMVAVIPNAIFLLFNFKTEEFEKWKSRLLKLRRN